MGRLVPIKNHRFFLEMAESLLQRRKDLHFVIVGGGEEEQSLKQMVSQRSLTSFVTFLGWRKDLLALYSDFDLVVLTSLNEGTPVSLIEAMASGKAVVATRVGGVPDVVQDNRTGFTVPPGDLSRFVEKVEFLLGHPQLRKEMGEAGRHWVRENFSKEKLLQQMQTLYEELLTQKKKGVKR